MFGVIHRGVRKAIWAATAILFGAIVLDPAAWADDFVPYHEDPTPDYAPVYNGITDCYDAPGGLASFCPRANNNGGVASNQRVPYVDPCFIAQNAMRPCTKKPPVGVNPKTVGVWKLPFKGGPWVWQIDRNGTYKFHSEAGDGVPPHEGKFASSKGSWMLQATNGYSDAGTYWFKDRDTWIATGHLGTAPWLLDGTKPMKAVSTKPASAKPAPAVTLRLPSRQ